MKKIFKREKYSGCKGGFTLIELLVVIAIIAILSTIVIVTYNSLRKKARDSERKTELEQISKLVDIYMVDNESAPLNGSPGSVTTITQGFGIATTTMLPDWKTGLASGPALPVANATYYYTSSGATYAIGAKLESSGTTCSNAILVTAGVNYCITSE